MKLVKITDRFFTDCQSNGTADELLFNEDGRPSVLIVRLKYNANYKIRM